MIKEFQGEYRWLSNFWLTPIYYEGRCFRSVEHAYMSAKSTNEEWKNLCSSAKTPGQIKRLSRSVALREDWDTVKVDVMYELLKQKFSQGPLMLKLLATGEEILQEGNNWGDSFWGVSLKTGQGKNVLGLLLMRVRSELRA